MKNYLYRLAHELHSLGILGVEVGVTICVMCTIAIFDALSRREGSYDPTSFASNIIYGLIMLLLYLVYMEC